METGLRCAWCGKPYKILPETIQTVQTPPKGAESSPSVECLGSQVDHQFDSVDACVLFGSMVVLGLHVFPLTDDGGILKKLKKGAPSRCAGVAVPGAAPEPHLRHGPRRRGGSGGRGAAPRLRRVPAHVPERRPPGRTTLQS